MGLLSREIKITTPLLKEIKNAIEQAQKEFNNLVTKDEQANKKRIEAYKRLLIKLESSVNKIKYNINYLQR